MEAAESDQYTVLIGNREWMTRNGMPVTDDINKAIEECDVQGQLLYSAQYMVKTNAYYFLLHYIFHLSLSFISLVKLTHVFQLAYLFVHYFLPFFSQFRLMLILLLFIRNPSNIEHRSWLFNKKGT